MYKASEEQKSSNSQDASDSNKNDDVTDVEFEEVKDE